MEPACPSLPCAPATWRASVSRASLVPRRGDGPNSVPGCLGTEWGSSPALPCALGDCGEPCPCHLGGCEGGSVAWNPPIQSCAARGCWKWESEAPVFLAAPDSVLWAGPGMDTGDWKWPEGAGSSPARPGLSPPPSSVLQAPEDRRLLYLPVGPAAGAAPHRAVPAGCLARLAGHAQVQHHVPVLPGGLHGSRGHKEGDRPTEVPAPKVREAAVTAGGGQTDGQDRSRAPLTCVVPATLLPLPSLEPLSFPAP